MSFARDLKILYHLALSPIQGGSHQERLESFYAGQADDYDAFRERLLQGRRELYEAIPVHEGGVWVELGGGTASNLEHLGPRLASLRQLHVVDLSPSLLRVAESRCQRHGWGNVALHERDATTFTLPELVDVVTFSYSLTMIPDWFAALDNARRLLKPGGVIGVVDFFVSRKHPAPGFTRHHGFTRAFWPLWFGMDNVFLSPDHVPHLHHHFRAERYAEQRAKVPFLPLLRVPYYQFLGRKPA